MKTTKSRVFCNWALVGLQIGFQLGSSWALVGLQLAAAENPHYCSSYKHSIFCNQLGPQAQSSSAMVTSHDRSGAHACRLSGRSRRIHSKTTPSGARRTAPQSAPSGARTCLIKAPAWQPKQWHPQPPIYVHTSTHAFYGSIHIHIWPMYILPQAFKRVYSLRFSLVLKNLDLKAASIVNT